MSYCELFSGLSRFSGILTCMSSRHPTTNMAGPSVGIPQELVDLVVDELSGDKPTLKACSLTCRSWVYRSQYRLHKHLFFSNVKHLTSSSDRYLNSTVAAYVNSLDLSTLPTSTSPYLSGERIQVWVILTRLTQVRRLTVRNLEDAATVTPFITMAFPNVSELVLGTAEFDSFAQFKSFFAAFAHVKRFQLDTFDVFPWLSDSEDDEFSEDDDDYLEFPRLQHLTLSGRSLYSADLMDLASWLRSELPGSSSLRSLTFETWYGGRFGTMRAYLVACRRSLQTLQLPMGALESSVARLNFKRLGTLLQALSMRNSVNNELQCRAQAVVKASNTFLRGGGTLLGNALLYQRGRRTDPIPNHIPGPLSRRPGLRPCPQRSACSAARFPRCRSRLFSTPIR